MSQRSSLLRAAKAGDRSAIGMLLARYLPSMRAFARKHLDPQLGARESADDIVQSACREVLADLPDFETRGDGEAAVSRWLFCTTMRKLRDRHRHHKRHKRDVRREIGAAADAIGELHCVSTPSEYAIGDEEIDRLRAALDRLPPVYREAMELSYLEGLSHKEIGERLGRTTVAVNSLMARALARLATILERAEPR